MFRKYGREETVESRRHTGAAGGGSSGGRGTTAARTEQGEKGITVERNGPVRASAAAIEFYRRERGRRGTKRSATVQLCLEKFTGEEGAGVSGRSPMTSTITIPKIGGPSGANRGGK